MVLGALADSVQEVIELDAAHVVPPPKMGTRVDTRFIRGIGKREDGFFIVLDIDRVLSEEDLRAVAGAERGAERVEDAGAGAAAS